MNVLCQSLLLPLLNKSMHRASIVYRQRNFYHLLKTPNHIALLISPDDYDTTVNRKENTNVLMFLMFLHFTEPATRICSLKKVFTTCGQKTLEFFQWLWLLTIINFITEQLFVKHPFLKNTSAWPLLTSKFYSEFDFMFCYHKVCMLQKEFSQLFFAWSEKWWVWLKLWNNHSRDWINNFPKQIAW